MPIEIRKATEADEPALEQLFRLAFRKPLPDGEWRWKYAGNPHGRRALVAVHDGRLVGHFAAWPTVLWKNGESRKACSATDVMTAPAARFRGRDTPILRLGRSFFEEEEKSDDPPPFVFGFPGFRHREFGERFLGYRCAGEVTRFLAEIPELSRQESPAGEQLVISETLPAGYDALWDSIRTSPGWRTDKSRGTLHWRYHARPNRYYRFFLLWNSARSNLEAVAIVGFDGERALVAESLVSPGNEGRLSLLFAGVAQNLSTNGIVTLEARSNPNSPVGRLLSQHPLFRRVTSEIPLEVRPVHGWPDPDEVARQFDYSAGDYDVV